jgi:Arc/MetJ family transcription regulator
VRTTLDLDDELLRLATNVLVEEAIARGESVPVTKTHVVEEGLRALLRERAARRLASQYSGARASSPSHRKRVGG